MILYAMVEAEAARLGTAIAESELIGFIPRAAFEQSPEFFRRVRELRRIAHYRDQNRPVATIEVVLVSIESQTPRSASSVAARARACRRKLSQPEEAGAGARTCTPCAKARRVPISAIAGTAAPPLS